MGELFEFFMSNIFIVILIIGALSKIFSGRAEENQKEKTSPNRPSQPTRPRQTATTPSGMERRNRQPVKSQIGTQSISIEDQQKQQLEKLAGRMNTKVEQSMEDISHNAIDFGENLKKRSKQPTSLKKANYRKQVKNNLSRDGLINGIIMSEVLGPPRARKPYRNVIVERKS